MALTEIFLLLLVAVVLLSAITQHIKIPASITMLIGGLFLAYLPGIPGISLSPETVFLLFLPPLLFEAAYFTSMKDFKANMRPILLLAIGLVAATSFLIGWLASNYINGFTLAVGVLLGAIIAPPDAVAASSIARSFQLPRRVVTILEGESLLNDATSLVIYNFAIGAIITGNFSMTEATISFLWLIAGGLLTGSIIGLLFMRIFRFCWDETVAIILTFLAPYVAYMAAEHIHASGVLSVVTAGLIFGWKSPEVFSANLRLSANAVWKVMIYLINSFVFLLIGLQLPNVIKGLEHYTGQELFTYAAAVCGVIIILRIIWVFTFSYGLRWLIKPMRLRDPYPPWQAVAVISWTGMRGVVSLAMALALPLTLANGQPFEERNLVIFLTYCVIFVTLVGQGMSLPLLLKYLKLQFDTITIEESWRARKHAAESGLAHVNKLLQGTSYPKASVERMRNFYTNKLEELGDGPNTPLYSSIPDPLRKAEPSPKDRERALWEEVLQAEHSGLLNLRKAMEIGDEAMHELQRELDLMRVRVNMR